MQLAHSKQILGNIGEQMACQFVHHLHYEVLERNWRCGHSEIDIVAKDPNLHTIVFIEVKTRTSDLAFQSICISNHQKMALSHAMEMYCNPLKELHECRFDLIKVLLKNSKCEIHHDKAIFSPIDFE